MLICYFITSPFKNIFDVVAFYVLDLFSFQSLLCNYILVCATMLKSPEIFSSAQVNDAGSFSWCPSDSTTKEIRFTKRVTVSGMIITHENQNSVISLNVVCKTNTVEKFRKQVVILCTLFLFLGERCC